MARIPNALLDQKAFGRGANQPMLDVTFGGQNAFAPNLTEWVSNQAYVRRNLICVLLEAPRFFQLMPDPQKWVDTLKSIVELHAKTIEGLNGGITLEFDEHAVGGAGEMQQEVTDSKRARSEPVFTFVEKYGLPIQTFLYQWLTYGVMDPDTKIALVNTLTGTKPTDMLADQYTASMLFMEPDPSHTKINRSWVCTNMMPKSAGTIEAKRDLTAASEILTLNIEFTSIAQFNLGTNLFAQSILDQINQQNANPYTKKSFISAISSDVAASTESYRSNIENLGKASVLQGAV